MTGDTSFMPQSVQGARGAWFLRRMDTALQSSVLHFIAHKSWHVMLDAGQGGALAEGGQSVGALLQGVPLFNFSLHSASDAENCERIQASLAEYPRIILADFCLAERNMSMPSVAAAGLFFRAVGGERGTLFHDYMKRGALAGITSRLSLRVEYEHFLFCGAAVLRLCSQVEHAKR